METLRQGISFHCLLLGIFSLSFLYWYNRNSTLQKDTIDYSIFLLAKDRVLDVDPTLL